MRLCLALALLALPIAASEAELRRAFSGKPVRLKIDLPGSHLGVDLLLDRDDPIDWAGHAQRIKNYGIALHKGQDATVTSIVVKKDSIEFHLDGGGFGTFGDDTSTTVSTYVPKSSYERRLENDIRRETDSARRSALQRDLSRERSRRQRKEYELRAEASTASAIKSREVMEKRLRGGSRFNLRHVSGTDAATPEAVRKWLDAYVAFAQAPPAPALRRGMSLEETRSLLGEGRLLSESIGADNINTQQWEFENGAARYKVTAVDGLVVRFATEPR